MAVTYELKGITQTIAKADGTSLILTTGFTTGVVGCPLSYGMIAGDTVITTVENSATKTEAEMKALQLADINAFIAAKYPST